MGEPDAFDLDAAGLRADSAELARDVEVLAAKLEGALPQRTRVERRSRRIFSKDKLVEAVEVRLGGSCWSLRVNGAVVDAAREQEVRGVVIKREALELEAWVSGLTDELRDEAQTSESARAALQKLVG
jgi:hypothetical protein